MALADLVSCPARCFEGQVYPVCRACGGSGRDGDTASDCTTCNGNGELAPYRCSVCNGSGRSTLSFARLYEASQRTERHDRYMHDTEGTTLWNGDDVEHPGITDYSLAMYMRRRDRIRTSVVKVIGRPTADGETEGNTGTHEVDLLLANGERVTFHGFAWAYGGEGPHGLAYVLVDLGFFDTAGDAHRFVQRLPEYEPWVLDRKVRRVKVPDQGR